MEWSTNIKSQYKATWNVPKYFQGDEGTFESSKTISVILNLSEIVCVLYVVIIS